MPQTKRFAPDSLEQRKGAKHSRFVTTGSVPTSLDGVQIHLSSTEREHMFSAPNEEGPEFRRLRRFGLLLSRYGLVDKNRFVKRRDRSHEIVTVAERLVATYAYRKVFGGDPTIGVANVQPLVSMLNTPTPSHSVIVAALAYAGTQAGRDIVAGIKDEELRAHVENSMENVWRSADWYSETIMRKVNKEGKGNARHANTCYDHICSSIDGISTSIEARYKHQRGIKEQQESQQGVKGNGSLKRRTEQQMYGKRVARNGKPFLRQIVPSLDGWAHALLDKMPLTLPHTGRKGRKLIPMPYGKSIRFIVREDTDPEQRVFARKTRSKGGVVIVDCSGSMSFTSEHLDTIMAATAGATVLCYSSGNEPEGANIWLVARGGRRTSILPNFPGNNGVDGPALELGVSMRRHNEPVVWVSDTAVTGRGDVASGFLRDWCLDFCAKHEITIVRHAEQAATTLRKIQLGQRPDRTNYKKLKAREMY